MKKIVLPLMIAAAGLGITSCSTKSNCDCKDVEAVNTRDGSSITLNGQYSREYLLEKLTEDNFVLTRGEIKCQPTTGEKINHFLRKVLN